MLAHLTSLSRLLLALWLLLDSQAISRLTASLSLCWFLISDFLDGWLARHLNKPTVFGALLDPFCDGVLLLALLWISVVQHWIPSWFLTLITLRYSSIILLGAWLLYHYRFWPQAIWSGKVNLVLTLICLMATLLATPHALSDGLLLLAALWQVLSFFDYFRHWLLSAKTRH